VNFVLSEMTFMRYFIPLIIEGNRKNISSTVFVNSNNNKYNNPLKHWSFLDGLAKKYDFQLKDIKEISNHSGIVFMIEGVGVEYLNEKHKKISLTYMVDFVPSYGKYIDKVDYVVFPSKFIAEYYGILSDKNLYLGSPKYDIQHNKQEILKKYNIQQDKKLALVVFPRKRDLNKANLDKIYSYLKDTGYTILVKTRGKDPVEKKYHGDYYFVDYSWFPHDTLELLYISDVLINFGSTAIKEAALMNTPAIDFNIKPADVLRGFDFLYKHNFCSVLQPDVSYEKFCFELNNLLSLNLENEYDIIREKYFFEPGSSSRIFEEIL